MAKEPAFLCALFECGDGSSLAALAPSYHRFEGDNAPMVLETTLKRMDALAMKVLWKAEDASAPLRQERVAGEGAARDLKRFFLTDAGYAKALAFATSHRVALNGAARGAEAVAAADAAADAAAIARWAPPQQAPCAVAARMPAVSDEEAHVLEAPSAASAPAAEAATSLSGADCIREESVVVASRRTLSFYLRCSATGDEALALTGHETAGRRFRYAATPLGAALGKEHLSLLLTAKSTNDRTDVFAFLDCCLG